MRWQFGVEPATQPQAHCPVVEARLCGYRDTKAGWDFIPAYVSELAYGSPPLNPWPAACESSLRSAARSAMPASV